MAYVAEFKCKHCGELRHEVVVGGYPYTCASCRVQIAAIEKHAFMEKKRMLPIEKRIEIIEEYLYDSNIADRLKALEYYHHTYA